MITEQTKRTVDFTGSASRNTMRVQDLVPKFLGVLAEYHPDAWNTITDDIAEMINGRNASCVHDSINYDEFMSDDSYALWQSEEIGYILNEDIWDAMQEIAPDGFFFGAHPGDGADYGFWAIEEDDIW